MTDQMDRRLEELVNKLADSAPAAPPFPRASEAVPTRRVPAWLLATAAATVVLVMIGLPFLVFSGRNDEPDVATTAVDPTPTTLGTPTTTPEAAACTPAALSIDPLQGDGAAGHVVTPLRFTNVAENPCILQDPLAVTGIGTGGEEITAQLGTYIPIGSDSGSLLPAGSSRTLLIETGTGCVGGSPVGPVAEAVRITLAAGTVEVPFSGDLGCMFAHSGFGDWSGEISTPACTPAGLIVWALGAETELDRTATPFRFINVSGDPCLLEGPLAVTGIADDGQEMPARPGTSIPIADDAGPLVAAGDSRTVLVEVGTACNGGQTVGPLAQFVRFSLPGGEVVTEYSGDLGCDFGFSAFGAPTPPEPPTAAEREIVEALVEFAQDPSATRFGALPLAESVTLTLGPEFARVESAASLADPGSWVFGRPSDGFRARTAPFSALALLAQPGINDITAGPHDHCAGPPMPVHDALAGLRQISIQPAEASSCLDWWVVDVLLTDGGDIAGITLDLWEP